MLTSQLFNLLNELINRSDLTIRIINLSNELLETFRKIENCEDRIGKSYWNEIYKSIKKIELHCTFQGRLAVLGCSMSNIVGHRNEND